jgi:dTMP kinase
VLLSFEGIDGCGKTTQIMLLRERFQREQIPVEVLREPGGTELSERIRNILLDPKIEMNSVTELLLFSAARSELVSSKIKPLLAKNVVVILDRFFDSTVAYQGFGRGCLPIDQIHRLNTVASHGYSPELTFYLDIDVKSAADRRKDQLDDRMEKSGMAFYERVREGFRHLAAKEKRFIMLDALQPPEAIHSQIWKAISKKMKI